MDDARRCYLCPRRCGAARGAGETGACGESFDMRISRIALHPYEEPPISGRNGSGTVFFCGCSLRCVFCQNRDISRGRSAGKVYTPEALGEAMLSLEKQGATNINLVTPTHFAHEVAQALRAVKDKLSIPVVYNTSGYETVETLRMLEGLVDIYMPDFKYMSAELAGDYSSAPDYGEVAEAAVTEMYRQVGRYVYADDGTLKRGLLVRHLVLPGCRADSMAVLRRLAEILPTDGILLSLMSQYTPDFALDCPHKNLRRRLTRFEYDSVAGTAISLGFDGFMQSRSSAVKDYTPNFEK
ncbi:MAG: radical SAM protein [Clostridia bacterium]|nr:radical SAM protein [Clostridia bacterium]